MELGIIAIMIGVALVFILMGRRTKGKVGGGTSANYFYAHGSNLQGKDESGNSGNAGGNLQDGNDGGDGSDSDSDSDED